jgi:hypothetical protein
MARISLTLVAIVLGMPLGSAAGHLSPPAEVTCPNDGTTIMADWSDVDGATKYSVDVVAGYDVDGDGVVDVTIDRDFGTSDRADGAPIGQSDLAIPLSALVMDFDTDGDGVPDLLGLAPGSVMLRVKALHPGRAEGPQNAPFSAFCTVL